MDHRAAHRDRVLRPPTVGLEGQRGRRSHDADHAHDLRRGLRVGVGTGARADRRLVPDRRVPRERCGLRRSAGRVRDALREAGRRRPRAAERSRDGRSHPGVAAGIGRAQPGCDYAVSVGTGSIGAPWRRTSKWRCGPVEIPVLPTSPMTCPGVTTSPTLTSTWLWCPYRVASDVPWSITTQLPYPPQSPATTTIPAAAAWIGVRDSAPKSRPGWKPIAPPMGSMRRP